MNPILGMTCETISIDIRIRGRIESSNIRKYCRILRPLFDFRMQICIIRNPFEFQILCPFVSGLRYFLGNFYSMLKLKE